jgi:large subunit ribosomal protein L30e
MKEIREAVQKGHAVLGTEETIKLLRRGKVKKIFLCSNVSVQSKETIERYSKLKKVEVVSVEMTNEELGTLCKKPFAISVIGVTE